MQSTVAQKNKSYGINRSKFVGDDGLFLMGASMLGCTSVEYSLTTTLKYRYRPDAEILGPIKNVNLPLEFSKCRSADPNLRGIWACCCAGSLHENLQISAVSSKQERSSWSASTYPPTVSSDSCIQVRWQYRGQGRHTSQTVT